MEVSGQLHNPAALLPEKEHLVPIAERLGRLPSRSGRADEENPGRPTRNRHSTDWAIPTPKRGDFTINVTGWF
jgi:hypothetical protein